MIEDQIKKYINQANIMQLATCDNNQSWVVTVHYYAHDDLNIFWTSRPDRRHSKEIALNPLVSSTMLIHENTATENWVIGITVTGQAEILDNVDSTVAKAYIDKLKKDKDLPDKIQEGRDPAKWYRIKPSKIVLFDSLGFKDNPRQEWVVK